MKIAIFIVMFILMTGLVTAAEIQYTLNDGKCENLFGENRFNSPSDCALKLGDYSNCLLDSKLCTDKSIKYEGVVYILLLTILGFTIYRVIQHKKNKPNKKQMRI